MNQHHYAVILAGGRGERFWPLSTVRKPKQLLALIGRRPLISAAVDRLQGLIPPERIFIITNADLVGATRAALPGFPRAQVIGEPVGRDTAAAVTLGAALIKARDPRGVFCVLTADHVIGDGAVFRRTLREALGLAGRSDVLITIGLRPRFPSTGFGYLEIRQRLPVGGPIRFFKVRRFVEKPDRATAARYLRAGRYYWNSGMFIWSLDAFQNALRRHRPVLLEALNRLAPAAGTRRLAAALKALYPGLEKISVDYALMEKADNIVMAQGGFAWDDVGSWSALENHLRRDAAGNVVMGDCETLESTGNIVVSTQGLVSLIGVQNLVVVQTRWATLVCPKERAQDVKRMVAWLRKRRYHAVL